MKYVLQIVFALTSNPCFEREILSNNQLRRSKEGKPMKKTIAAISIAVIAGLTCPAVFSAEEENEQAVKMSDLPAAVQTTIKDKAASNETGKVEQKTEKGKIVYDAGASNKGTE